jgi:hypothetical protein
MWKPCPVAVDRPDTMADSKAVGRERTWGGTLRFVRHMRAEIVAGQSPSAGSSSPPSSTVGRKNDIS